MTDSLPPIDDLQIELPVPGRTNTNEVRDGIRWSEKRVGKKKGTVVRGDGYTATRKLDSAVLARQVAVAELLRTGYRTSEIARKLDVNLSTIKADISLIRKEWEEHRLDSIDEHVNDQLEKLAKAETAMWPLIDSGKAWAVDRLLGILEQRAKLLGLYQPVKVDVEHKLREMAVANGLDPDQVIREAESVLSEIKKEKRG